MEKIFDGIVNPLEAFLTPFDKCIMRMTCKTFNQNLRKKESKYINKKSICVIALENGYYLILNYIMVNFKNGYLYVKFESCVEIGIPFRKEDEIYQIEFLEYRIDFFRQIFQQTINNGNVDSLKLIKKKYISGDWDKPKNWKEYMRTNSVLSRAFEKGYLNIIIWMFDEEFGSDSNLRANPFFKKIPCQRVKDWLKYHDLDEETLFHEALNSRYINVVKWLKELEVFTNYKVIIDYDRCIKHFIIRYNDLNLFEWMKRNSFPLLYEAKYLHLAAYNGKLKTLQWLVENGSILDSHVSYSASLGNYLNILKWLKEKACFPDKNCYYGAFINGNLEMLDWLKLLNCPMDDNDLSIAYQSGKYHIFEWIKKNQLWKKEYDELYPNIL